MAIAFSNAGEVKVDESAELVAVLVEMEDNKRVRAGFSDFPDILISGNLVNLSIFALGGPFLDFLHAVGHVLSRELVIEIYSKATLTQIIFSFFELLLVHSV